MLASAIGSDRPSAQAQAQTYTLNEVHADDELEADQLRQWFVFCHFRLKTTIEQEYASYGDSNCEVLDYNDLFDMSILPAGLTQQVVHAPIFVRIGG